MNSTTLLEKNLTIHVPENQQTVTVRLEIESSCTCAGQRIHTSGSYTDVEPSGRSANA